MEIYGSSILRQLAPEHRDLFFAWVHSCLDHDVTTIHAGAMAQPQAAADTPSTQPTTHTPETPETPETPRIDQNGAKSPPPEKPADVRRRGAVILSFWLIVGLLGLPIWWYTTTIYRANLPLDAMMEWADGKACRPVFPLRIAVQAAALPDPEANHLLRLTQHALDDLNDFSGHHLRLELFSEDTESALTIRLSPEPTASLAAALDPLQPVLHVTYPPSSVPSLSSSTSTLATFVATQLRSTFAEEQAVISYLLSTSSVLPPSSGSANPAEPRNIAPEIADALSKRTMRSLKYAPTYHLTFSLFTGGPAPSSWDIEAAIAQYMQPVLDVLAPIHNFTIDTQVQLYATPGVQSPVLTSKQDLSSFINAAEWPLSPSIGGAPTINFIVYAGNQTIQSQVQAPKKDNDVGAGAETSQSWLIPQWGSVYLLHADASHVPADSLREPLLTFTSHLLALLGTPTSGSLPLRLSTLSRIRSADLLLRASSTLGSLARLSLSLRSIAIPSSVAEGVASTMEHLRLACDALGGPEGLAHARIAEAEAERAFFEKSMVGQLYFPDEHKVAVYLPLLGPVGVPLVMGLVNELKAWLRRRKERAAAGGEKKKQ